MEVDLTKAPEAADNGGPAIRLDLLELINQARNEHGMRQQDYARYRRFCTEKVHRLRQSLHLTHNDGKHGRVMGGSKGNKKRGQLQQQLSKKQKQRAQSAAAQSEANKGKGNVFTKREIKVEDVLNDRPAQLLLFEAERAWAFAQELRQTSFGETGNDGGQDAALRRRGLARARKAVGWAEDLVSLLLALGPKRIDVVSRAQVAAYSALIRGNESFDKDQWKLALEQLSVARRLLQNVAECSRSSRAEALANSFVDTTEAQLRYSAYQLDEAEQDMDKVAASQASTEACERVVPGYSKLVEELEAEINKKGGSEATRKNVVELDFHGKKIPIRNAELVDVIVRVRAAEENLAKAIEEEQHHKVAAATSSTTTAADNLPSSEKRRGNTRQRLTSAQRTAKKRGSTAATTTTAATAATASGSASATKTTSLASGAGAKTEMDPYDGALAALTEAEDVARRLVADNQEALNKSHSTRYEAKSIDLVNAHECLMYKLMAVRVARNAYLVDEVEKKAERRQKRAKEAMEKRLNVLKSGSSRPARKAGQEPVKRRQVNGSSKKKAFARPVSKKAGSRKSARRPGRSGTRRIRAQKMSERAKRLVSTSDAKSRRRSARAIPGIARLLDNSEVSLLTISSLGLVEANPDVSSLIEAKSALYRAELLRHLAGAYLLSNAYAESLLILLRASLFVRQARQATDLVDDVRGAGDDDMPPSVLSEETMLKSEAGIEKLRLQAQRGLYFSQRGVQVQRPVGGGLSSSAAAQTSSRKQSATSSRKQSAKSKGKAKAGDTKAGQAIRDLTNKHVDFDPIDVEEACRLPEQRQDDLEDELRNYLGQKSLSSSTSTEKQEEHGGGGMTISDSMSLVDGPTAGSSGGGDYGGAGGGHERTQSQATTDEYDVMQASMSSAGASYAYDPGNLLAEEEERAAAEAEAKRKAGWLGGWFRK